MPGPSYRRHLTFGGLVHPEIGGLIVATLVLSLVAAVGTRNGVPLFEWLSFVPARVFRGEVWRLITGVFIEMSPISLLFSCLALYWFGRDLADVWGAARFLRIYLTTAVVVNAITCAIALVDRDALDFPYAGNWPLAEALIVAWAAFFPERQIRLYFIIPIGGRLLIYLTIGTVLAFAAYYGLTPFIPHLVAIAYMSIYIGLVRPRRIYRNLANRFQKTRRQERVRVSHLRPVGRDEGSAGDDEHRGPPPRFWN